MPSALLRDLSLLAERPLPWALYVIARESALKNRLVLVLLAFFISSCMFPDPYRQRDIRVLNTGIVLETSVVSGEQVLEENPEIKKQVYIDAVILVLRSLRFDYVSSVKGELDGRVKALVHMLDGKNYYVYYPDPKLRIGDCLEMLLVDGVQTFAYAANCPAGLEAYNKQFNSPASQAGTSASPRPIN